MGRLKPQPFREVKRRLQRTVDTAIVPKKSEVPIGTLRSILSQAHIDPYDWDDQLTAETHVRGIVLTRYSHSEIL